MKETQKPPKIVYAEPDDYFPKEIRKKYKIGDFAPESSENDSPKTKRKTESNVKK